MNLSKTIKIKLFLFLTLLTTAPKALSVVDIEWIYTDHASPLASLYIEGEIIKPFHDDLNIFKNFYQPPQKETLMEM